MQEETVIEGETSYLWKALAYHCAHTSFLVHIHEKQGAAR
jgi:hypothetical protein